MNSSNESIVLYGGQGDVFASVSFPADDMPYMMLETSESGIQFGATARYYFTLEHTILRLHAFGEGGDLLIRRDEGEDRVFWRFVGKQSVFDTLKLSGEKYPQPLRYDDNEIERSLLWGKYDDEDQKAGRKHRYEARMGGAKLNYPDVPLEWSRVEIHARCVIDESNQIVAYWTYELASHSQETQHQPQEKA